MIAPPSFSKPTAAYYHSCMALALANTLETTATTSI